MVSLVVQIISGNLECSRNQVNNGLFFGALFHSNASVKVNITFGASLVRNCTQKDAVKRFIQQVTIFKSFVPSKGRLDCSTDGGVLDVDVGDPVGAVSDPYEVCS